jgi:O-antigen/teichoic acid export membrane protein
VIFALVNAKTLVSLWLGPKLSFIAVPFALLVFGNLFPQVGSPTHFVLVGKGVLRPSVYSAMIACVLNVVLSLVFIARWGFVGAVWGTVLPMIISTLYFFFASRQYLETSFSDILRRAYLKPLLCSLAGAVAMYMLNGFRMRLWPQLLVGTAIYGVVYLVGLGLTRFFDAFDFSKAERHLPFARLALRIIPMSYRAQN